MKECSTDKAQAKRVRKLYDLGIRVMMLINVAACCNSVH